MTDRYMALTVTLERDTREDDAQGLIQAILQLRGVADVTPSVMDITLHVATTRVRQEMRERVCRALDEEPGR